MNSYLNGLIGEAEDLVANLLAQAEDLAQAIADEITAKRILKDAEQALSQAESEAIVEAEMQAQDKTGPLAGIAKTSTAYKAGCETLIAEAHRNGLRHLIAQVQDLRLASDNAQIAREQHAARYSALKHAADLRTAILNVLNS